MSTREDARDTIRRQVVQYEHTPGPIAKVGLQGFALRFLLELCRHSDDSSIRARGRGIEDGLKEAGLL